MGVCEIVSLPCLVRISKPKPTKGNERAAVVFFPSLFFSSLSSLFPFFVRLPLPLLPLYPFPLSPSSLPSLYFLSLTLSSSSFLLLSLFFFSLPSLFYFTLHSLFLLKTYFSAFLFHLFHTHTHTHTYTLTHTHTHTYTPPSILFLTSSPPHLYSLTLFTLQYPTSPSPISHTYPHPSFKPKTKQGVETQRSCQTSDALSRTRQATAVSPLHVPPQSP